MNAMNKLTRLFHNEYLFDNLHRIQEEELLSRANKISVISILTLSRKGDNVLWGSITYI